MSDENAAPFEPETIVPQTIEPKTDKEKLHELPATETVDNEAELDDSAEQSPEAEFVTVERNGKHYQVPKELEGEFLMQSDYTKKTQTTAEKAKVLESREAEINQRAEATEAELDARAQLKGIAGEIERFKAFDFAAYQQAHQTDPLGAEEAWNYKLYLNAQKAELEDIIGKTQNERTERAQQDLAKRVQETTAFAQKEIPGFKADTIDRLVKFAVEDMRVPEKTLKDLWSPIFLKLLHRADIGEQALKRQAVAPKAPQPAAAIAPLQTVTAKAQPAARLSLAELAKAGRMEEYAAARKAGRVR